MGDVRSAALSLKLNWDQRPKDTTTKPTERSTETPDELYNRVMQSDAKLMRRIAGVPLPQDASKQLPVERPSPVTITNKIDVPPINTSFLYSLLSSKFEALDLNHNQVLDKNEVQFGAQTQTLTPAQGLMMVSLVKNLEYFQHRHNDSFFEFGQMVTMNDMREFHSLQARVTSEIKAARGLESLGSSKFAAIDRDNDGFLTITELDQYSNSTKNSKEKDSIAFAKAKFNELEEASNDEWFDEDDGITRADLTKFREATETTKEAKAVIHLNDELNAARSNLIKANPNLYANPENPLKSITPDAIKPGSFNNSTFESWLRHLATTSPHRIVEAIRQNQDGSYTVTFPDATPSKGSVFSVERPLVLTKYDRQVEIPAPTTAELAMYTNGGASGIWPAVFAKAFGRYMDRLHYEAIFRIYNNDFKDRNEEQETIDNSESKSRGRGADSRVTDMAIESAAKFQDRVTVYGPNWKGEYVESMHTLERSPGQNGSIRLKWDPADQ